MAKSLKAQEAIIKRLEKQIGKLIQHVYAINFSSPTNQYSVSENAVTGLLINGCDQLDLSDNQISDLTPLENLRQLRQLDVSHCAQLNLPPEIVEKSDSPQEILGYWFRSRTQPARPLNEAKLLVVGETRSTGP